MLDAVPPTSATVLAPRDRRLRVVGACAVAVAFAAALVHLPSALRSIDHDRTTLAALAPVDRPLVGAFSTDIDRGFLHAAKATIPSEATYAVVTGTGVQVSSPTTIAAVPSYFAYWLAPRVQVPDPHRAQWVVSYGGDLAALGLRFARTVQVSPGLVLAEVAT